MLCLLVLVFPIILREKLILQYFFYKIEYYISTTPYKYLRVQGCLAKMVVLDHKKRKICYKTSNCMFLGYVEHNVTYNSTDEEISKLSKRFKHMIK